MKSLREICSDCGQLCKRCYESNAVQTSIQYTVRGLYVVTRATNFVVSTATLGFVDASSWLAWRHRKYNVDVGLQQLGPSLEDQMERGEIPPPQQQPLLAQSRDRRIDAVLAEAKSVIATERGNLRGESDWLRDEINKIPWFDLGRVDAVFNPFRVFVVLKSGTHEIPDDPSWRTRVKKGFSNLRSSMTYLAYFGALVAVRGATYFANAFSQTPSLVDIYGSSGIGHDAMIRDDPASYNSQTAYSRNLGWFHGIQSYETSGWPNAVDGILWGLIIYQASGDVIAMIRNVRSHGLFQKNVPLVSSVPVRSVEGDASSALGNPRVDTAFSQRHWWEKLHYNVVNSSGEGPNLLVWGILIGAKCAHSFVKDFYEGFIQAFPSYSLTPTPDWANPVTHTCYDHRTGVVLSCATRFMEDFNNRFNSELRDQFSTVPFIIVSGALLLGLYHQLERRRPNAALVIMEVPVREQSVVQPSPSLTESPLVVPVSSSVPSASSSSSSSSSHFSIGGGNYIFGGARPHPGPTFKPQSSSSSSSTSSSSSSSTPFKTTATPSSSSLQVL